MKLFLVEVSLESVSSRGSSLVVAAWTSKGARRKARKILRKRGEPRPLAIALHLREGELTGIYCELLTQ